MRSTPTLEDLARLSSSDAQDLFSRGALPDPKALVDWEYRGYNLPFITRLGGFQKFRKGFYERDDEIWGYNIPVRQGGLDKPWDSKPTNQNPKRFGFFRVTVTPEREPGIKEAPALLLDYSKGANGLFEGSFLRDYVRRVTANDDLLIGKAYVSLAGAQMFPAFFIIERDRKASGSVHHPV